MSALIIQACLQMSQEQQLCPEPCQRSRLPLSKMGIWTARRLLLARSHQMEAMQLLQVGHWTSKCYTGPVHPVMSQLTFGDCWGEQMSLERHCQCQVLSSSHHHNLVTYFIRLHWAPS